MVMFGSDSEGRVPRHYLGVAPGTAPGTLFIRREVKPSKMSVICYGPDVLEEHVCDTAEQVAEHLGKAPVTWVNVEGIDDPGSLRQVGDLFKLHDLALEDVLNHHQRAKTEQYNDEVFVVVRTPVLLTGDVLDTKQIALFLGTGYVLTFEEHGGDCFEAVRHRIRAGHERVRGSGPDYLTYALIDAVIDTYFPVLEDYGERIERLELVALRDTSRSTLGSIQAIKRDLITIRRTIWPHREMLMALSRDSEKFVTKGTEFFLRDCYDHTIQLMDLVENYRELGSGLIDVYMSAVSNHMNDVMKTLTMIATIFIPLTFVAGIYGMNFNPERSPWNMPELNWYFGYPFVFGVMLVVALITLVFFYRKGWLVWPGSSSKRSKP